MNRYGNQETLGDKLVLCAAREIPAQHIFARSVGSEISGGNRLTSDRVNRSEKCRPKN